jgi:putative ABC transport system permease protein
VALAALLAAVLAVLIGWAVVAAAPAVQISITLTSVGQTTLQALVIGLGAALWPLRRIAGLDAATAFRETP